MRNDHKSGSKAGVSCKSYPNMVILKRALRAVFHTIPKSYDITITCHVIRRGVQKQADCPYLEEKIFYLPTSQGVIRIHPLNFIQIILT